MVKQTDAAAKKESVIDGEGHAHRAFQIDDRAIAVIRPDNHVGMIARPADATALAAYFDRLYTGAGARGAD